MSRLTYMERKMILNGAFNIKTNQFLGNDPMSYLMRDEVRALVLWGKLDTSNGNFVATRNPIKFDLDENGVTKGLTFGKIDDPDDRSITGWSIDNSTDYRGAHFEDISYAQKASANTATKADTLEYAAHLSKRAKEAMVANGQAQVAITNRNFFEMP